MSYAPPIIHYTFDVDGTNSGTYGSTHNLTIPSTNPTIFGVDNTSKLFGSGCLKIFKALGDNNKQTTDLYRIYPNQWTIPAAGCTFSMWIKVPAYIANGQGILDCKIRGHPFVIAFWGTGNEILVYWNYTLRTIAIPAPNTAGNYYDNQYHHFVSTVDSSSNVRVYIDTILKGTVTTTDAATGWLANSLVTPMYIGARANTDPPLFGHVDDFRVYDYPFTQANVKNLNITSITGFPEWNIITNSNALAKTYVNSFIDLSGDMFIRNNGALIGGGDVSFNFITVAGSTTFAGDTTLKSRLFIGNDISVNGNLYVGGDLSVNGTFSGNFANGIIPTTAIIDYPISSNVEITGNVRVAGDTSFNGTRVDLSTNTILQVSGNITFTDGTTLSTYVDDISSGSFAQGNVIFKAATFAAVTCSGNIYAGDPAALSDYRIKTNVTDLDESYSVDKLEPIQYDNILSNKHEFGLIAHELQEVYPELVKGEKDGAEYQSVNYNGLIGVLVKEVQEIKRRIEDLYTPMNI